MLYFNKANLSKVSKNLSNDTFKNTSSSSQSFAKFSDISSSLISKKTSLEKFIE